MTNREILGVSQSATAEEIKTAYRKLAMMYHPDRNRNDSKAAAMFVEVTSAYEALTKTPLARTPAQKANYTVRIDLSGMIYGGFLTDAGIHLPPGTRDGMRLDFDHAVVTISLVNNRCGKYWSEGDNLRCEMSVTSREVRRRAEVEATMFPGLFGGPKFKLPRDLKDGDTMSFGGYGLPEYGNLISRSKLIISFKVTESLPLWKTVAQNAYARFFVGGALAVVVANHFL